MMPAPFSYHSPAQPVLAIASELMPLLLCLVIFRPFSKLMTPPAPMMMMKLCLPSQHRQRLQKPQCPWHYTRHHPLLQPLVQHLLTRLWLRALWFYLHHHDAQLACQQRQIAFLPRTCAHHKAAHPQPRMKLLWLHSLFLISQWCHPSHLWSLTLVQTH